MYSPLLRIRKEYLSDIKSKNGDLSIRCRVQPDRDPFLCTCGPCRKFWRDTFSENADLLREPAQCRARGTATLSAQSNVVKIGDRVLVQDQHKGTVKWVGVLNEDSIAPELFVGVRLDDNVNSTHNGVYNGKRYFYVPRGHGAMVKYSEVTPLKAPERKPPISGNYMFPSWEEVQKRRKERNNKLQTMYASAGMLGPQFSEPYISSKPSTAASGRRSTHRHYLKTEPTIHIGDPNDIALKDMQRKTAAEKKRRVIMKVDQEHKEMDRLREQFGGGPDAERLALTFKKLQSAYQEGKTMMRKRSTTADRDSVLSDDSDHY